MPLLLPLPVPQCPPGTTPFHPFPLKVLLRLPFLPAHPRPHTPHSTPLSPPTRPLQLRPSQLLPLTAPLLKPLLAPGALPTMPHLFQDHAHFLPHSPQPCPFPGPPLLARPLAAPLSRHNPVPIPPPDSAALPLAAPPLAPPTHSTASCSADRLLWAPCRHSTVAAGPLSSPRQLLESGWEGGQT